jgi:hypothetical protein
MNIKNPIDVEIYKKLTGSLLYFTQIFYKLRTGRKFELSEPFGRESHYITVCRGLTRVINGECSRLIINIPPRYGKTEMVIHFIAWAMARFPASNFIYTSYSHSLVKKQTQTIRSIIQMPEYNYYFNVGLSHETSAKDNFETNQGGSVYGAGAGGTIVGRGAGIKNCDHFGGCIVIDDIHKPDEATSDTIREGIHEWYYNTLATRLNAYTTPIVLIGHCVHEDDLSARLRATGDWESIVLPAIDEAGNALHPQMHDLKTLRKMQEESPYNFASQYQQSPQPAGGGVFKEEWFPILENEPEILATFITADTAETDKNYNDATVFSFWGLYRIKHGDMPTDLHAIHLIDCAELRIEPKDIESEFFAFYAGCMRHPIKPMIAAIEKKSSGVTLFSTLSGIQGLRVLDFKRTKAKTHRFLEIQSYIATKRVSLPFGARHTKPCLDHFKKITANDTHRFDDIADTLYDAVKLALIDETVIRMIKPVSQSATPRKVMAKFNQVQSIKDRLYGQNQRGNPFG